MESKYEGKVIYQPEQIQAILDNVLKLQAKVDALFGYHMGMLKSQNPDVNLDAIMKPINEGIETNLTELWDGVWEIYGKDKLPPNH